jgi:hypothetical protein
MAIVVLGDSLPAWMMAAQASADSEDVVQLVAPDLSPGTRALVVETLAGRRAARVQTRPDLPPVSPLADAVIVVSDELGRSRDLVSTYLDGLADRLVLLAPGGAGGTVLAQQRFVERGLTPPILGETTGLPVLGSLQDGVAVVTSRKHGLPIGAARTDAAATLVHAFGHVLPGATAASSILATSLANTNSIVHPGLAIANAARIEGGVPFRFYREGLTAAGVRLIEAVDTERLEVTDALGLEHVPVTTWFDRFYGHMGIAGSDIGEMLRTFAPFDKSQAPTSMHHRYVVDDIGSGLAIIEALGLELGFEMATIGALCTIGSQIVGLDLRAGAASTAARLLATPALVNSIA